MIYIRFLL